MIDGRSAGDNVTTRRPGTLINGRPYNLLIGVHLQGDGATISVLLDGEPYIRWTGKQASLALHRNWRLPQSKRPGLSGYKTAITFHGAQLRLISGKALWIQRSD